MRKVSVDTPLEKVQTGILLRLRKNAANDNPDLRASTLSGLRLLMARTTVRIADFEKALELSRSDYEAASPQKKTQYDRTHTDIVNPFRALDSRFKAALSELVRDQLVKESPSGTRGFEYTITHKGEKRLEALLEQYPDLWTQPKRTILNPALNITREKIEHEKSLDRPSQNGSGHTTKLSKKFTINDLAHKYAEAMFPDEINSPRGRFR